MVEVVRERSHRQGEGPCAQWPRRLLRRADRLTDLRTGDESGMTLIEILIVLVILPIVVGGIAVAMITTLKDQSGIQTKLSDSTDSVVASSYYSRDIQSADAITTSASPSTPPLCIASGEAGAMPILSAEWANASSTTVVSYYYWTPPGAGPPPTELVRWSCQGSASPIRAVMSHNLATPPTGTSLATLTCVAAPTCNSYAGPGGWIPTSDITSANIAVTQSSGYQFTLTGSPLTGPKLTEPVPVAGPLLLLDSGTDVTFWGGLLGNFDLNGGNTVTVNGTVDLESGPTTSNSPAVEFGSPGDTLLSQGTGAGVDVLNCNGTTSVPDGTLCGPTAIKQCSFFFIFGCLVPDKVTPQPTSLSTAVPDPLAASAQANQPIPTGSGSCNHATWQCTPGVISGAQMVPSNKTVTFAPGSYDFTSTLTLSGNDTVTFGSGVYRFDDGFEADVNPGSGPNTLTSGSGGVLFYVHGGTADFSPSSGFSNSGTENVVKLVPMTSGKYKNLLFWQDGLDPNAVSIASDNTTTDAYQGEIYAPAAEIDVFGGTGDTVTMGPVCAGNLEVVGTNANIGIG